jgi:hypothetical protein
LARAILSPVPAASRLVPARIGLAVLAVALIAWFSVLVRDHAIGQAAVDRIVANPNMSTRAWNGAMDDLRRADLLDPSSDWSMARANYLLLRDPSAALRVAESIVRREPDNVNAWEIVERVSVHSDPRRAAEAARQIRRLNPSPARDR